MALHQYCLSFICMAVQVLSELFQPLFLHCLDVQLPVQDDLIGFRAGIPLDGDIVIALWFGNIVRETDAPAFTYAFHTAFVGSGMLLTPPTPMNCISTSHAACSPF
jgi:hypothetical protein